MIAEKIYPFITIDYFDAKELTILVNSLSEDNLIKLLKLQDEEWGCYSKTLSYVNNPSHKTCVEAIKCHFFNIGRIDNQTEELCLLALDQHSNAIHNIRLASYTEKILSKAIESNPNLMAYIENPSLELQLKAVKKWPYAIFNIDNPHDETIQCAAESGDLGLLNNRYCGRGFFDKLKALMTVE